MKSTSETTMKHGIFLAILAAGLYALSSPFSKLLLRFMPSTLMAGFLYIGAGLGMTLIGLIKKAAGRPETESRLTRQELPYTVAMIVLDIAAPGFPRRMSLSKTPFPDILPGRSPSEIPKSFLIAYFHHSPNHNSMDAAHSPSADVCCIHF